MIRRQLDLSVPPERAFRAWTEAIHLWWPPGHTRRGGRVVLERDRFVERTDEGDLPIGAVVEWAPPGRLVYDFYLGSGPEAPTRVQIDFEPAGAGTRVQIVHSAHRLPADRFGSTAPGFRRSWAAVLTALTRHLEPT